MTEHVPHKLLARAGGFLSLLLVASTVHAAEPDALALMKQSDKRHQIKSEKVDAQMILQKEGGEQQARRLTSHTVTDEKQGDKFRVLFTGPANIKGTALLTLEVPEGDADEQWLYLPAFKKTRRVGQAELGDRFVGSDIYFEDLQRREIEDYSYKIVKSEQLDGQDCWVIESLPLNPKVKAESPYGKSLMWLRKDNLFVVLARLFDKNMKPLKEIRAENLKAVSGDAWRADKTSFVDIQRKHRTVLIVEKREIGADIPEALFSKHGMERAN